MLPPSLVTKGQDLFIFIIEQAATTPAKASHVSPPALSGKIGVRVVCGNRDTPGSPENNFDKKTKLFQ